MHAGVAAEGRNLRGADVWQLVYAGLQGLQDADDGRRRNFQLNPFIDPAVAGKILTSITEPKKQVLHKSSIQLSDREMDIMQLMARGLTNADIARELFLSEGTVRNYTSAIFAKLGVNDRTQAVIAALRHGLVNLDF